MRVVHMTTVHRRYDTRIFVKMCRSLAGAGLDVHLVTTSPEAVTPDRVDGVQIHAVTRPSSRLRRIWSTADQAIRLAQTLQPDIYHFHDPEFLIRVPSFQRHAGRPVIYDAHEDIRTQILYKEWLPRPVRRLVGWLVGRLEDRVSGTLAGIVTATPSIARRFRWHERCVVLNNYPLSGELDGGAARPKNVRAGRFAYVGGITAVRSIREIVRSLPLAGPDVRLALGGTWETESLHKKCAAMPGWRQVEELGFLERSAMRQLLQSCQAGLVLFYPHENHLQAQPNKMFEYMSAGLPVIASHFPLWQSIIRGADCGLLVDPLDPLAIADAMRWVLEHPDEGRAMGERGREAVRRQYNWEHEFPKLLELYRQVAACGGVFGRGHRPKLCA